MSDVLSREGLEQLIYPIRVEDYKRIRAHDAALREKLEAAQAFGREENHLRNVEAEEFQAEIQWLKGYIKQFSDKAEELKQGAIDRVRELGFVFERAPSQNVKERLPEMSDGEKWEHMAFAVYTDLMHLALSAEWATEALAEPTVEANV